MPIKPDDEVVLHTAYVWSCPECGAETFGHMVEAELTEAEKRNLREMMGEPDDDQSEAWKGEEPAELTPECGLVMMPDRVTCPKCGVSFGVFREPGTEMPDGFDAHRDLNG